MQEKTTSNYHELIAIIRRLSVEDLEKLHNAVTDEISLKNHSEKRDLQSLLLSAPVCTDEDYNYYLSARAEINRLKNL